MSKRRLPVLVEHAISAVDAQRQDIAERFVTKVTREAHDRKRAISCSQGCDGCCHHPISISVAEGVLLYRHLQKVGVYDDLRESLQETSDAQVGLSFRVWMLRNMACPLLDGERRCRAYAARPMVCRTAIATSDPYYCHPHRLGESTEMPDRTEPLMQFFEAQDRILKGQRISSTTVPLATAVLLAEKICEGEIEIGEADKELIKEYVGKA